MPVAYLDHNILSKAAGVPQAPDAQAELAAAGRLVGEGWIFALSAWSIYELAGSNNDQHIDQCCAFVESLPTIWVNTALAVRREEIRRWITCRPPFAPTKVRAFSADVFEMWSRIGGGPFHRSFREAVTWFRRNPSQLLPIRLATYTVPEAILAGRRAQRLGVAKIVEIEVERAYFHSLAPDAGDDLIEEMIKQAAQIQQRCPCVAVEDALTDIRRDDQGKPKPTDAIDLQHVLVPLAYCEALVSDDKRLVRHSQLAVKQLGLSVRVVRRLSEL